MNKIHIYYVYWIAETQSKNVFMSRYKARAMGFDDLHKAKALKEKLQDLQIAKSPFQQCFVSHIGSNF